ncbi:hypothetical protein WICPIJ_001497 [Wickerhamomyces pijperi]|uniref:Altered inheritance of mitochondria protein 18, mitochondrial n=1 Tax=Wickerhamomyces pijperi TaxID=599730 RepID=A0A9P8QDH5_WICPI|nr:hypothetical protein WICPIJ_001497 [Wickerhamomyces pijperi]
MSFTSRLFTQKSLMRYGAIATAATLAYTATKSSTNSVISLNGKNPLINDTNSVSIPKSGVDPIPLSVNYSTIYQLLGYGSRYVTFLSFRVYNLGLYIAREDIDKIRTVFDSKYLSQAFIDNGNDNTHQQNVHDALKDPVKSKILISNFLDSNVRLLARITPVRNTDFGHLKDGLIKSILASGVKDETLGQGLQELRDVFSRKGSVPKNHNLILERLADGSLKVIYENTGKSATATAEEVETVVMGTVQNPIISKLLFLQYLSGGLSADARDTAIDKISKLV